MCCFSGPVTSVGGTKIFARGLPDGRQLLAYAMNVTLDAEVAMVLPLPVPPRACDDAVRFVDLAGYDTFFEDVTKAFPAPVPGFAPRAQSYGVAKSEKLVVHDVGMFEASFVPKHADFVRLDARFRLPDGVWRHLPAYADWGFAVFRLKPNGRGGQRVQSMAFSFPRREPDALFGPLPNRDVWLRPPRGVALEDLRGHGVSHAFEVRGGAAFMFAPSDPAWQRRKETSATRLGDVCRALREGLRDLETRYRGAWELAPLSGELAPHFMNGDQLWTGTTYLDGRPLDATRARQAGRITFTVFTGSVEPQSVTLAFARLPDPARLAALRAELSRLLDGAVS